jgi:hypothetical protein
LIGEVRGHRLAVDDERRLVQCHGCDGHVSSGGFECEHGAGGVPEDMGRAAGGGDHGGQVVDFAIDRVLRRITAVATFLAGRMCTR